MFKKKCIPYKLSFLLHGVPGTGKTTFLKALSNYTNRHIVNISLPLIETNEQLIEIFHSHSMQVHGKFLDFILLISKFHTTSKQVAKTISKLIKSL